ncbi:hypothetical protein Pcinc_019807 [Petrolisthes cinctipes]|uniref:Uncharacterized protein n=1 Tax=Petrolisthes cinctipes TaxID=88211 RepID=A0AAE1FKI6_PETCI|nr:hypothetical protein Pcinc_019807 [Petrolisthes cinctipes]
MEAMLVVVVMICWISVYSRGFAARDTAGGNHNTTQKFTLNPGDTLFTTPLEEDAVVEVWAILNPPTYIWQYPLHLFLHTEEVDNMDQCGGVGGGDGGRRGGVVGRGDGVGGGVGGGGDVGGGGVGGDGGVGGGGGGGGGGVDGTLSTIINKSRDHKPSRSITSECVVRAQLSYDMYEGVERLMTCCCASGEEWHHGHTQDGTTTLLNNKLEVVQSLKFQMDYQTVNITDMDTNESKGCPHHHQNNNNNNQNNNNNNNNSRDDDVVVVSSSGPRRGRWCLGVSVMCDPVVTTCGNVTVFLHEVSQRRTHSVAHRRKRVGKRSLLFGVPWVKVEWLQLALGGTVTLSVTVLVSLISYINLLRLHHQH